MKQRKHIPFRLMKIQKKKKLVTFARNIKEMTGKKSKRGEGKLRTERRGKKMNRKGGRWDLQCNFTDEFTDGIKNNY